MIATVLRIRTCLSCSRSICILFRSSLAKMIFFFLSYFSCHSSPTLSVLEQNYDPCSLSSSYLCRMQTYCHPFRQKKTTQVRCLIWQPHKRSRDSTFDVSCRPLSAPRVCIAHTRDAPTISCQKLVRSSVCCGRSTFDV